MALVRSIGRNADGLPGVAAEIEVSEGNDDGQCGLGQIRVEESRLTGFRTSFPTKSTKGESK